jgi:dTDP-6-deoxy-L-talose 4-dehydrogenase (NAD+)
VKIAVTGATGFIGRHVVCALLSKGDATVLATSRSAEQAFAPSDALHVANIDISNADQAAESIATADVLVHLAWSGLPNYQSEAHLVSELPRQMAFLKSCSQRGIKRIVVSGTCLEYGMQTGELVETQQSAPSNPYAEAKQQLHEQLLRLSPGQFGLTWLRIFYLFGAGQSHTSLYSQLRAAVESGRPRFAMSPGDQIRDFLPVEIAADMIAGVALRDDADGTFNVCSGQPVEVATLARRWLQEWNAHIELDLGTYPYPAYEPFAFWGSADKIDHFLHRTP